MGNIIKRDLVEKLAEDTGFSQIQAKAIVNNFFESIKDALVENKNIEIRGFGQFKLKTKSAKRARNPKSGEQVIVEERVVPIFTASKLFTDKVNDSLTKG